jgi:hypothetical protein
MSKLFVVGLFFAFSCNPALADGSVSSLGMGMGAKNYAIFQRFQAVIAQYNASGERFRIDSHCQSACTMFLSIRNVCVTPNAKLLFHAGGNMKEGRINPARSQEMLVTYNSALRQFVNDNHYMDTFAFHTISGRDIITKFGYPACKA